MGIVAIVFRQHRDLSHSVQISAFYGLQFGVGLLDALDRRVSVQKNGHAEESALGEEGKKTSPLRIGATAQESAFFHRNALNRFGGKQRSGGIRTVLNPAVDGHDL